MASKAEFGTPLDVALPRLRAWTGIRSRLVLLVRTVVTRRELAEADDRTLRDLGISPAEALAETRRPPWSLGPRR